MEQGRSIAIVGLGGVFPDAPTLERFWDLILHARDAAAEPPEGRWPFAMAQAYDPVVAAPDKVNSKRGCYIRDFRLDIEGLDLEAKFLESLDPMFHLGLHAARAAVRGAVFKGVDRKRVGVIFGNIALPTDSTSRMAVDILGRTFAEGVLKDAVSEDEAAAAPINRYAAGLPAGVVAKALGLGGGTYTLDAACASSLYAVKLACDELDARRADAMLAGGLSRPDCFYTQMGFSQLRAVSPTGTCSPFDAKGNGLVVGEGAGMFVLKRLEDALAAGDTIHGVIRGAGLSNDVEGNLLAPSSEGQLRAMRRAYEEAGWAPHDVDLIECHATGTPVGDAVEVASLKALWGEGGWREGQCVIGSVKSNVGHLLTGAGAAGLMKALLALAHRVLPPTANFSAPGAKTGLSGAPFRVNRESETWEEPKGGRPRRAAVSGFGFGGINAHVLLEQWAPAAKKFRAKRGKARRKAAVPVAVVGMGAHFGRWKDLREFQERVLGGGADHPAGRPRWFGAESSRWFKKRGLTLDAFRGHYIDSLEVPLGRFRIPPNELREMLPQQLLMLMVAAEAVGDAGWGGEPRLDAGVFIGMGLDLNTTNFHFRWDTLSKAPRWARRLGLDLPGRTLDDWMRRLRNAAAPALSANRTMGALGAVVASRVAREFRIGGPSFTIQSEESSGIRALEAAVRALRSGELAGAVVGAVDLAGDIRSVLGAHAGRPFSATGVPRPFDAEADGAVPGEGAAALVLKRLDDALRDGDRVYCVIRGLGGACGGGADRLIPDTDAYVAAMERAYLDAEIDPGSVGYLEAHGSAYPPEDRMESESLARFRGPGDAVGCVLGSAKADVGHAGAASGLASVLKAALCLYQEVLPPLRNYRREMLRPTDERLRMPSEPRYWLRDRKLGPRRAAVSSMSVDGNCTHVVMEAYEGGASPQDPAERLQPLGARAEALFAVEGAGGEALAKGFEALRALAEERPGDPIELLARRWFAKRGASPDASHGAAVTARDARELRELAEKARRAVRGGVAGEGRVFYRPEPLGSGAKVALVFPGSGNHFPGMGRELSLEWPDILRRQDAENEYLHSQYVPEVFWNEAPDPGFHADTKAMIFGQVALGTMVGDLVRSFGVRPDAVIGYSLGESAGLFALRAWKGRDEMLRRMNESTLFTRDLAGRCEAARKAWKLPERAEIDWMIGVLEVPAAAVREAIKGRKKVYLLIVNTPDECVIGGERGAVEETVRGLGGRFHALHGVTTVHCEAVEPVRKAYRDLHLFEVDPPPGVRFYSGCWGTDYELSRERAAESVLEQALYGVDFPKVILAAYRDGVRVFLEMGPGASTTRMVRRILKDRPHAAASACSLEGGGAPELLRLLARLVAERVPVDLAKLYAGRSLIAGHREEPGDGRVHMLTIPVGGEPFDIPPVPSSAPKSVPRPIRPVSVKQLRQVREPVMRAAQALGTFPSMPVERMQAVESAKLAAHRTYLRVSTTLTATYTKALNLQMQLLGASPELAGEEQTALPPAYSVPRGGAEFANGPAFNRAQCLEFGRGKIGDVLGPEFAPIDSHPTRVRLPDEPLMLVDRILEVDAEPRSMASGRVVTEHDVLAGAWYLDGGRIPTCIAVEAGQADLFLSGYLGIDFKTKGLAVYRLLDAVVTFHGPLPPPGASIRYDIRIERFFRQGKTYLFRFNFEATVGGEKLLTMTEGCAGFFTAAALAAGEGIVHTALDKRLVPGRRSDDWEDLVPLSGEEAFGERQVDALRRGDLGACFGPAFSGLGLRDPLRLPKGRMRLVDRVTRFDPEGGRFGLGQIRAEADIHPDDWFLTCHFVDDKVMPGTLMYECCLHTLRIFLTRLGWVGERDEFVYEPAPGVRSRLKCRGQVIESAKVAAYEISIKELGYTDDGTPLAIADALMYSDGRPVVEIIDMSVRLSGLTRSRIRDIWAGRSSGGFAYEKKPAIFDTARILAFAVGKPSEAFGAPYQMFDQERVIARLPGPPYQFLDRITAIDAEPWKLKAGAEIEAQYDVPADAWYFGSNRQQGLPFAVLLEAALQPCGWLAAFLGSALTSKVDVSFRNLGGTAIQHTPVHAGIGTLSTKVKMTQVANSGGMIIEHFKFSVSNRGRLVYAGKTYFGFFPHAALADQIGIRDAKPYRPSEGDEARAVSFPYCRKAPFPDDRFRMVDFVDMFVPDGGPHGLGLIRGTIDVNPEAWFFKAHFYQDPVWPGSLGLESFLQLLKVYAADRWQAGGGAEFENVAVGEKHEWVYRGQILPTDKRVIVQATVTRVDDERRLVRADGFLSVDGRVIYALKDFTLRRL